AKSRRAPAQRRAAVALLQPPAPTPLVQSPRLYTAGLDNLPSTGLRRQMVQSVALQRGNAYVQRYLRGSGSLIQRDGPGAPPQMAAVPTGKVAFVSEEGLNLRDAPNQKGTSLRKMPFGQRVYLLEDPNPTPSWVRVTVLGQT